MPEQNSNNLDEIMVEVYRAIFSALESRLHLIGVNGILICTSFGTLKCTTYNLNGSSPTALWSVAEKRRRRTFRSL